MDATVIPVRYDCDSMALAKPHLDAQTAYRPVVTVPGSCVFRISLLSSWEPWDCSGYSNWSAGLGPLMGGVLAAGVVGAAGDWPGASLSDGEVSVGLELGQPVVDAIVWSPTILWLQVNADGPDGDARTIAVLPVEVHEADE